MSKTFIELTKNRIRSSLLKLQTYYKNHHFTDYVKNKRVIIVGPDSSLEKKGLGTYIDSFDIVIRHNTAFDYLPFSTKHGIDFGYKTDIIYFSPTCMQNYANNSTLLKLNQNKIKYIVYQNGNKNNEYMEGDYCFPDALDFYKRTCKNKLHYSHHSTTSLTDLLTTINNDVSIVPRTGFISIYDMLVHEAKEINIIGMTFYNGGTHMFRSDALNTLDPHKNHTGGKSPHDSVKELELMDAFQKLYPHIKFHVDNKP